MVTEGQEYVEQGIGAYEKRRLNRKFAHLDRQARKLGLQLVPGKCKAARGLRLQLPARRFASRALALRREPMLSIA